MDARIDQVVTSGEVTVDGTAHEMENNTYVLGDDEEVIVIDPGLDAAAVLEVIGDREVLAVICTNGHPDHVAAALDIAERDEAPIALHPKDLLAWRETFPDDDPDIEMADGGLFGVADVQLEVIHSPGHTPGSVSLFCEELGVVFSGDALLATGPARFCGEFPDFPGQLNSIGEHLLTLPPDTEVLPTHGGQITVAAAEKRFDRWVTAGPDAPEEEFAEPDAPGDELEDPGEAGDELEEPDEDEDE